MRKFIIALFIIALPYRFFHFFYPLADAFNFRQTQTATFALNFYKNGINLFQTELDIFGIGREKFLTLEFPLYEAIVATLYKLFFLNDIWGRLVSIISGFVAAWYLYKLVEFLSKNKKLAFFAVFFFLFTPLPMFYQRAFMIETTVIAFLVAGLFYFVNWVQRGSLKDYILTIITLSLGFIQKGLYGPFWLLPIFIYYINKKNFRAVFSTKFFILLLLPLLTLFFWQRHVDTINTESGQTFFTSTNQGQWLWNFGSISDRLSISMWSFRLKQVIDGIFLKPGLLLFLFGLLTFRKFDKNYFFVSFLVSQFIYFATLFRIQAQNYYQLVMIPAITVFMVAGLLKLSELLITLLGNLSTLSNLDLNKFKKFLSPLIISLFCSFFVYKSFTNILPSFYIDWDWYTRIRNLGKAVGSSTNGIFAVPGNEWNSIYSYYSGKKLKTVDVAEVNQENIKKWQEEGYSFIVLSEYEKYHQYLAEKNKDIDFAFLVAYQKAFDTSGFKAYLFK